MKRFEELLSKRKAEIESEEKARKAEIESKEKARKDDAKNFNASVGAGVIGLLVFGGVGFLVGIAVAIVVEVRSCIANGTQQGSGKYGGIIVISAIIIGGALGFYNLFIETRKKH